MGLDVVLVLENTWISRYIIHNTVYNAQYSEAGAGSSSEFHWSVKGSHQTAGNKSLLSVWSMKPINLTF